MLDDFCSVIGMAPGGEGGGTSLLASPLFMLLIMFAILYMLIIRPQKKREDQRKKMLEALKKNDRVVTAGGMHGQITAMRGDEIILRIDQSKDVRVKFNKSAVSKVLSRAEGEVEEDKS